ncbi:polyprenyl synthetase family protein [Streptomyces sioyaensis]|uniref:polyprenyl synthetase family protein n=1 Tax=Streptomyces sioyaensis TaxID=67364 RepID=UPI001F45BFF0|nr:polyprenyl synthetase family protein [Streptomyces sioyaensis]MCF3172134.1 polyprenyl synthetase family protein [Streptomyces sioyaensis]
MHDIATSSGSGGLTLSDSPRDGKTILAQTATRVGPLIRERINGLSSEVRHLVGLHFGWWDDNQQVQSSPDTSKSVRPALALLACQAVGGPPEAAHAAAVAVELVHNASLLHDDIIDHDSVRRGRSALWAAKGIPAAILAGDALFFAAVQALTDAPAAGRTVPILLAAAQTLIEGEYLDVLLETGTDVSEDWALAVAAGKTGELLACACELGAIAGGADPECAGRLRAFGLHLGIAFQCTDDLLGIWGEEAATGKPALSDLRQRKVSLPVAATLAERTPQAQALRALYRHDGPLSNEHCRQAKALIEQTGARQTTARRARCHSTKALHHLAQARPAAVPGAELAALARLLADR